MLTEDISSESQRMFLIMHASIPKKSHSNETPKKKYFRIEKEKHYSSNEAHSKAIFTTKKNYNFLRRKTLREIEIPKINKNNNKFITTTIDDSTASAQSENSFLVKNIIPRKLKLTQENKKIKNNFSEYNKEQCTFLRTLFIPENKENFPENKKKEKNNNCLIKQNWENCRIKFCRFSPCSNWAFSSVSSNSSVNNLKS